MRYIALAIPLFLVGLIGCTDDRNRTPGGTTPATPPASTAPPAVTAPGPGASSAPVMPTMSEADRALATRVSDAFRADTALSTTAQNVQVYAQNGQVTLTGSVSSAQEKTNLEAKARQVTGVTGVNNELEVASASR